MVKLTEAQRCLLADAARPYGVTCSDNYKPAIKLVSLGLAIWTEGRFSDKLEITDAGRAALGGET